MPPKRKEKASGRIKVDTTSSQGRKGYMEIMNCMWKRKVMHRLNYQHHTMKKRWSREIYVEHQTEEIEEHNQQDNIISENIEVESIQTISEDICINENANISNQSSTVTIDQPIQNQPEIPNIERRSQVEYRII